MIARAVAGRGARVRQIRSRLGPARGVQWMTAGAALLLSCRRDLRTRVTTAAE